MKIVTHNGHFHADELLAVAALLLKYPNAEIVRTRDEGVIKSGDIVVDVGHIYDPEKMRFDHHQPPGAGKRHNDIPYASFGLVWKEFGTELAGGLEEMKVLEERLVMPVDALDNQVGLSNQVFSGIREYTIGDYFESFTAGKTTLEELDEAFKVALALAQSLLDREIKNAKRKVSGWHEVRGIYNESENKKIVVLPAMIAWKKALIPTEAFYVIYPRPDRYWAVQAVPNSFHGTESDVKKPFPTSWAGMDNGTLAAISGVKDAMFCHRERWLAKSENKEGAVKLAEIALNS